MIVFQKNIREDTNKLVFELLGYNRAIGFVGWLVGMERHRIMNLDTLPDYIR